MAEQENNGACSSESCSGCAHADSCASKKVDMTVPANEYTHVKKVIGVISGKAELENRWLQPRLQDL